MTQIVKCTIILINGTKMNILKFLLGRNDEKVLYNILFYILVVIFSILSIIRVFNSTGYLLDTYEHIHASYLISIGDVPYRDFFEHHNPLLWYIFAPFTQLFYRDVSIIYVARIFAVLGYLTTIAFLYVVSLKYSKSDIGAKNAVIFILCFSCFWEDIQNLRPDIFMYISMLVAILNIFKYLDTKRVRYLSYSYFSWLVAFLFLQKAMIYGFAFCISNIFLIFKNKIKLKDIAVASIIPLSISVVLFFVAYKFDVLKNWYVFNFDFNVIMKKIFGVYHSGINPEKMKLIYILLSLVMIKIFKYSDKGIIIFSMWIAGFLQIQYFAPHPQY